MTRARHPVHLIVIAGLSMGMHAGGLAVVTSVQSATDSALRDARDPIASAADRVTSAHDELDSTVAEAARAYEAAANDYELLSGQLQDIEADLDRLTGRVSKIAGVAGALPTRISLPTVSAAAPKPSKPVVQAKTRASG